MLPHITPARMLRLCLKELRESLRDRRTIVTLVLMPLLVYPLLSLVLNRILLTGNVGSGRATVRMGFGPEVDFDELTSLLAVGYELLQVPQAAPVFIEDVELDRESGAVQSMATPQYEALPIVDPIPLSTDGRSELREKLLDLVIIRRQTVGGAEQETGSNPPASSPESRRASEQADSESRSLPDQSADGLAPSPVLSNAELDLGSLVGTFGTYEVRYRDGDPQSESALQLLERMMAAVNNRTAESLLAGRYQSPFRLRATPVSIKSNYAQLLATLVPLVLVLMTMAGAVYPAIDLTAGERERGTMEALIVSPTPGYIILLAKYSAVVTVALLTALANLGAMTITLWVSGIGKMVFGDGALTLASMGTILVLLVLFTMFFAALLLAITSFAKSFKEAQAYLIPLMLLALTPGVMSLLPGIKFTVLLATVPLVNIVLLAREVLAGRAEWDTALVAVICNSVYALCALVLASRLFGSDASMHGSKGSWRDLLLRPQTASRFPSVDQMALTMSAMFPLYFIASSSLPGLPAAFGLGDDLSTKLLLSMLVSFVLILGTPLVVASLRNIDFRSTFLLHWPSLRSWGLLLPAALLLGVSCWTFAHEIFLFGQALGIGTINSEQFDLAAKLQESLKQVPLWIVLLTLAVTPAVCEEFLFRGFVLSSFHRQSRLWAILFSAFLFGLMHVLTSNVLAVERFLPTTFMGIILGWIAVRTGSLWPGMLVHALHNGLLLSLGVFEDKLKAMKILVDEGEHLPIAWLIAGALGIGLGATLIWLGSRSTTELGIQPSDDFSAGETQLEAQVES